MNKVQITIWVLLCTTQQVVKGQPTATWSHQTHLIHLQSAGTYLCSPATKGRPDDLLRASEVNTAITDWIAHDYVGHKWRVPDKRLRNFVKTKHWVDTGLPKQDEKACEKIDYVATLDSQMLRVKTASEFEGHKAVYFIRLLGHDHGKDGNGNSQIMICGVLAQQVLQVPDEKASYELCQWTPTKL